MDVLALGSVVILKGNAKKVMIVARAVGIKRQDETRDFEYAGCEFPEGFNSDELMFFDFADIGKVVFEGYKDDTSIVLEESIREWAKEKGKVKEN